MKSELNYLLGWLACDAGFESNGLTIGLQLQKQDEEIVDMFCRLLGAKKDSTYRTVNNREYVRARLHSVDTWKKLVSFFQGRLKHEKHFPNNADHNFIVGCLDADGTFYNHKGYIIGEFGHASGFFLDGLKERLKST